jgi:hypothetical protein
LRIAEQKMTFDLVQMKKRKKRTAKELGNWILSSGAFSVTPVTHSLESASGAAMIGIGPERDSRIV